MPASKQYQVLHRPAGKCTNQPDTGPRSLLPGSRNGWEVSPCAALAERAGWQRGPDEEEFGAKKKAGKPAVGDKYHITRPH